MRRAAEAAAEKEAAELAATRERQRRARGSVVRAQTARARTWRTAPGGRGHPLPCGDGMGAWLQLRAWSQLRACAWHACGVSRAWACDVRGHPLTWTARAWHARMRMTHQVEQMAELPLEVTRTQSLEVGSAGTGAAGFRQMVQAKPGAPQRPAPVRESSAATHIQAQFRGRKARQMREDLEWDALGYGEHLADY